MRSRRPQLSALAVALALCGLAHASPPRAPASFAREVRLRLPARRAAVATPHPDAVNRYPQLREMLKSLFSVAPPDHSFYVGVGRTPTGLVALLENLGPDMAAHVPASGLKANIPTTLDAEYFAHFDHFVPPSVLRGDRSVVFIDGSYGGGSAERLRGVFQRYLAARGLTTPTRVVVFHDHPGQTTAGAVTAIGTSQYALAHSEPFAPFVGEHNIGRPGFSITTLEQRRNPAYEHFRDTLRGKLAEDTDLPGWLDARYPHMVEREAP